MSDSARTKDWADGDILTEPDLEAALDLLHTDVTNLENKWASIVDAARYASVNAAYAALPAGGGVVYIPPGTYSLSAILAIAKDKVWIRGAGMGVTILQAATNLNADLITIAASSDWIRFSDLTIDGNLANQSGAGPYDGISTLGTGNTQVVLENVEVTGTKGYGTDLSNISHVLVKDCYYHDGGRATANDIALDFTGSDYAYVWRTKVITWNGNGIFGVTNAAPTLQDCKIIGCKVDNLGGLTTPQAISVNSYNGVYIAFNDIEDIPSSGIDSSYNNEWTIIGNRIINFGKDQGGPGILCGYGATTTRAKAIVSGNTLKVGSGFSAEQPTGIRLRAVDYCICTDNVIELTRAGATAGISCDVDGSGTMTFRRFKIGGNTIYGTGNANQIGMEFAGVSGNLLGPGEIYHNTISQCGNGITRDYCSGVVIVGGQMVTVTTIWTDTNGDGTNLVALESATEKRYLTFFQDNVAATQTNVLLSDGMSTRGNVMLRAGSMVGVVVRSNEARTAGTLTIGLTKNGAGWGSISAILDGTNTTSKATSQRKGVDTFVAGDAIGALITTTGTWTPTTADIIVTVEVEC